MARRPRSVIWARAAVQDLEEIVAFIATASPGNARRVLRRLRERASVLEVFPERGRVVPELSRFGIRALRELVVRPYRLIYRVTPDRVLVLAVFDGRRDIEEILLERLIRER